FSRRRRSVWQQTSTVAAASKRQSLPPVHRAQIFELSLGGLAWFGATTLFPHTASPWYGRVLISSAHEWPEEVLTPANGWHKSNADRGLRHCPNCSELRRMRLLSWAFRMRICRWLAKI